MCEECFSFNTSFKNLIWRDFDSVSSFHEVAFVLEGDEAFFWILMEEGWDMQMPRSEQRSSVRALAPPLRRRRLILLWVALSCWLYWCKQMDVAMHTAFMNWFVVSALLRSGIFPFKLPGWQMEAIKTASFGHFTKSCWYNDSLLNFLISPGDFSFRIHSGS